MLVFTVLLCLLHFSTAQVPFLGPCSPVTTVQDFNFTRYLGRWYEAERYFSLLEFAGKCVTTEITDTSADNITQALIVTHLKSWLTNIQSTMKGQMRPLDQRGDISKMYMRFSPMDFAMNHWVLDTDYDNFAVVYSCMDIGSVLSTRNAWILTRARNPSLEVMEKAYAVIDRNNITRAYLFRVDQTDKSCPDQETPGPHWAS